MPKQRNDSAPVGALKIPGAAKYIGGVAEITIRRLIASGKIKPCRNIRHVLIPIKELDRWLEESQDRPARTTGRHPKRKAGKFCTT